MAPWIAATGAVFLWWFLTGAILVAVRRAGSSGLRLTLAGLPLLAGGAGLVALSLRDPSIAGVLMAFGGALCVWGWVELAFLAGTITGWERRPCPPGLAGRARFERAFAAVGWHELALAAGALALTLASAGAPNRVALATYLILFLARITAKLNLYFGVPRINEVFLPDRLAYLASYFRRGPVTWAFPVAVTLLTALLAVCAERLWSASDPATVVGYALLTTLAALALLEHWLMVIPLPDAKLWAWMLPSRPPARPQGDDRGL